MRIIGAICLPCAAALVFVLAAGCAPTLTAQSAAPPGRSARLDEVTGFWGTVKAYRIELSSGVALAVTCDQGGPCQKLQLRSDDPRVAEVRTASLGTLERAGLSGMATSTGMVVVGKAAGTTTLHVQTAHGRREVSVTIVPPPAAAPAATVAR